jgi:adenine deaminase
MNPFNVIRAACVNPVLHYGLDHGLVRPGDPADFILVEDLRQFRVRETWIEGQLVARNGISLISHAARAENETYPNQFSCRLREAADFFIPADQHLPYPLPAIEALDGQLITGKAGALPLRENGCWVPDPAQDLLKIVVVNRYRDAPVAKAFIRNFGLKQGALASSVAHDSHNIVAVGVDDEHICRAVNGVIRHQGGISCVKDNLEMVLPLPVAGLMSGEDGYRVAELYTLIDQAAKDAGSTLRSPFMTLSFMALLVIPHLKLSDLGLFDGDRFQLLD